VSIVAAAIQLQPGQSLSENLQIAKSQMLSATKLGANLLVLPELFSAPFVSGEVDFNYFRWAEKLNGPTNSLIANFSRDTSTTIISSFFEATDVEGIFHNTAVTFHHGAVVSIYRKSHLPFSNSFPEKFYFRPGDAPPSACWCGPAKVGTIICYERHFPELGRLVALSGAHILAVPVACSSGPSRQVFQLELQGQAAFNELFVVCANRVGQIEGDMKNYFGLSAIYAPDGTILVQASDSQTEVVLAEINLDEVTNRRAQLPLYRDRRVDMYQGLIRSHGRD